MINYKVSLLLLCTTNVIAYYVGKYLISLWFFVPLLFINVALSAILLFAIWNEIRSECELRRSIVLFVATLPLLYFPVFSISYFLITFMAKIKTTDIKKIIFTGIMGLLIGMAQYPLLMEDTLYIDDPTLLDKVQYAYLGNHFRYKFENYNQEKYIGFVVDKIEEDCNSGNSSERDRCIDASFKQTLDIYNLSATGLSTFYVAYSSKLLEEYAKKLSNKKQLSASEDMEYNSILSRYNLTSIYSCLYKSPSYMSPLHLDIFSLAFVEITYDRLIETVLHNQSVFNYKMWFLKFLGILKDRIDFNSYSDQFLKSIPNTCQKH